MAPLPENIDTVKQEKLNSLRTKLPLMCVILGLLVLIGICFSLWFFMFKSKNFKTSSVANVGSKQSIKATSGPQYFPSSYVGMSTEKTSQGVEVSKIISGGPADKAGLLNGDYIEKLGKTADFSNPSDIDTMSLLSTIQSMQDGEALYFQLKRGDQILNKKVVVQHTTDNPIWFSGDVSHSNFTLVLPEIKLDNIIRGWKVDNVAQDGDGYSFSDPVNNLVKLSVWESHNAYFDHAASAEDILQSLIPPSMDNYKKSKINTYPAVIYTQTKDDNDELTLRVSGDSNGMQMGVELTVPKDLSSKYQDTFNKIIDSVTVQGMNGTPRAALFVTINSQYDPKRTTGKDLPPGADVANVAPGGPADRAGIQFKDIITKINGVAIGGDQDLARELSKYNPGDRVNVTVFRNPTTINLYVTLGEIKDSGPTTP